MSSRKFYGKKNASITIEVSLSVALTVVVLFLVLGLFSDNLQTMAANSGIRNLFNRENEIAKTNPDSWGTSSTRTTVGVHDSTASQENIQVVAEQGLDYYVAQAEATISKYLETPPTTAAQMEDLAKALTIAAINNRNKITELNGQTIDYTSIYKNYGIKVVYNSLYSTCATTFNGTTNSLTNSDLNDQLSAVKLVTNW